MSYVIFKEENVDFTALSKTVQTSKRNKYCTTKDFNVF